MAIFENPNHPEQPQKGVYGWYAKKDGKETTVYIGQAGQKDSCLPNGTLNRGTSEQARCIFCSNQNSANYSTIDTDFIVGTAIIFFEKNGYRCVWKHINNDPDKEWDFVRNQKPILQDVFTAMIKAEFKLRKPIKGYWKRTKDKVDEAENELFSILSKCLIDGITRS